MRKLMIIIAIALGTQIGHAEIKLNNETLEKKKWAKKRVRQPQPSDKSMNDKTKGNAPVDKTWHTGDMTVSGEFWLDRQGNPNLCIDGVDCPGAGR